MNDDDDDERNVYKPTPEEIAREAAKLREKALAFRRRIKTVDRSRVGPGNIREWDTSYLRPRRRR